MSLTVHAGDYTASITHNLNEMAKAVGIYKAVWRPEEIGITRAGQLIERLAKGIELLKSNPAYFRLYDNPSGWGLYDNFVPWLERYLEACRMNPDGEVSVIR